MQKFLIRFSLGVAFFVAILAIAGIFIPTEYEVQREIVVDAPRGEIHPWIEDLTKWDEWGPWKDGDPTIKVERGDISRGVGASQSWDGRDGDGSLEITAADEQTGIKYDLFFNRGTYKCDAAFEYADADGGTRVIWKISGDTKIPVFGGYLALLMDGMMGNLFTAGLEKLKQKVEGK